jgi:hypothetical protein
VVAATEDGATFTADAEGYLNTRSTPVLAGERVIFSLQGSQPSDLGDALALVFWQPGEDGIGLGNETRHVYEAPGVHRVTVHVMDDAGLAARQTVLLVVDREAWSAVHRSFGFEQSAEGWSMMQRASGPPGSLTTWEPDGLGHDSARSFHVGYHASEMVPVTAEQAGYTAQAHAVLVSPVINLPGDWHSLGYRLWIDGATAEGDVLQVAYMVDGGEPVTIATFTGASGENWTAVEDLDSLTEAAGGSLRFVLTFTSDEVGEEGPGWFVDDVAVGGVDLELVNPSLWEKAPP